jgi:hypothetical protein
MQYFLFGKKAVTLYKEGQKTMKNDLFKDQFRYHFNAKN